MIKFTEDEIETMLELLRNKKEDCDTKRKKYEMNGDKESSELMRWYSKKYLIMIQKIKNIKV